MNFFLGILLQIEAFHMITIMKLLPCSLTNVTLPHFIFTGNPICFKKLTKQILKHSVAHSIKFKIHFGEKLGGNGGVNGYYHAHEIASENHFNEIESLPKILSLY